MKLRDILDQHGAIMLTASVAAVSFITGVLQIGTPATAGSFGVVIPLWVQHGAGFIGTVTGFLLAANVVFLRKGFAAAWYTAIGFVLVAGMLGVLQSSVFSFPLIVLSGLSLAALLKTRARFTKRLTLSPVQLTALAAVIGSQVYGTVGTLALESHFNTSLSIIDAAYYSIVTASTVGYGEIHPITETGRLFTISLILVGTGSFAAFLGTLVGPLIEEHLPQRLGRQQKSASS